MIRVPAAIVSILGATLAGLCVAGGAAGGVPKDPVSTRPAPVVRPAIPKAQLWQGAGVIVGDARGFDAARAATLRRNRFRWIALKVHHGVGRVLGNEQALRGGWAWAFRRSGIRVCGWGVLDQQPEDEARLVAALVDSLALECYIADAEQPHMGPDYGGDVRRSSVFVRAFRARVGALPAAVTTFGAAIYPWILPFDYPSWRDHDFALLPQAYLSVDAIYGPANTVGHAMRAGYPRERVHPMIGVGWTQGRRKHWGGDYVWRLAAARTKGFSVFLGETTGDVDFDVLGRGIARYGISR